MSKQSGGNGRKVQLWIGALISISLVAWLIVSVNWQEVGSQFSGLRYWLIIPAVLAFVLHFIIRAYRWRLLLSHAEHTTHPSILFDSIMVGNLATFVLPLRIGEFVRPYMLSRCTNNTFASSFVSVIIERFFDLSAVLLSFGLLLYFHGQSGAQLNPLVYDGAFALGVVAFIIMIGIGVGAFFPALITSVSEFFLRFLPNKIQTPLRTFINDFLKGSQVLKNGSVLPQILFWTFCVWMSCYLRFWLSLMIFPSIDQPTFLLAVGTGVLVSLAIAAPSAPGFVGVYEAGCIAAFSLFGLNAESATAYAIGTHILEYLLVGAFGCLALARNDLKLGDLTQREAVERT